MVRLTSSLAERVGRRKGSRASLRCSFRLPPRAQVISTAVGFGGNGAMLLPGLVTTLGNFPEIRGMVTGLMKSVFFLCASLYTEVSRSRGSPALARDRLLAALTRAPLLAHSGTCCWTSRPSRSSSCLRCCRQPLRSRASRF